MIRRVVALIWNTNTALSRRIAKSCRAAVNDQANSPFGGRKQPGLGAEPPKFRAVILASQPDLLEN
jgi:hypothetical protein